MTEKEIKGIDSEFEKERKEKTTTDIKLEACLVHTLQ
jgi:hypothetical protein